VGSGLIRALLARGHRPFVSSRRDVEGKPGWVYLDFEKSETYRLPEAVNYVFVVAAATNYERCEKDPAARRVNVISSPEFVKSALDQGAFVTFISTNSVFGGEVPWPHENAAHAPAIEYAMQKAEAERAIRNSAEALGALNRLNIVRLTKILGKDTSPLPGWRATWEKGGIVEPFSDLIFAPLSVRFVGESLSRIGELSVSGNLHLSGSENVSYVDLARGLASRWGVDASKIRVTTSVEKGVHIPFKPSFSGLGMERTTELCGISPQKLDSVVDDINFGRELNL
jgi:dTDP-4-dehydrorhamnose reductase